MTCEKCGGEVCQCPMEPPPSRMTVDDSAGAPPAEMATATSATGPDPEAWRRELSARLNRYRSRRKAAPPRYPSLQLAFGSAAPALNAPPEESNPEALESSADLSGLGESKGEPSTGEGKQPANEPPATAHTVQSSAKIIEFPRFAWGPPLPPSDQLAEPVIDRPRILEVPEVTPPLPALGGITIEPACIAEPEKRPGIDAPFEAAPLGRRLLASIVDGMIIGAASALFGFVFWKVALVRPPQIQLLTLVAGIPCLFWAAYQYLLIVHAGCTPGLRLARLHLSRFDGTPAKRSVRRWRVLASYLSAASLGMGYAWLFLDEDNLCWHDRITRTYLASREPHSKS